LGVGTGPALASQHLIPEDVRDLYEVREWRNACAVLREAHPAEWDDLIEVLRAFRLLRSEILTPGGRKSGIAARLDNPFYERGWVEKKFDTSILVDGVEHESPTHKVDCFKDGVGIEVEWNNKDPFYDRDLNNFRLLFELRTLEVGVVITRCDELQEIFDELGRGPSYGGSTTHMSKLLPRLEGGSGGGCPIVVFGIGRPLYVED
jgi:hypothetical protein